MAYATLADLKAYLGLASADDDVLLGVLLERATAAVEAYTGRWFTARIQERRYGQDAIADRCLLLDGDLLSIAQVVNGDGVDVTASCVPVPRNTPPYRALELRAGAWMEEVAVQGTWGYSLTPPPDIVHACVRLAAYFYRQRDAQVFDVTANPEQGIITVPRGIPADVKAILDRYRRVV